MTKEGDRATVSKDPTFVLVPDSSGRPVPVYALDEALLPSVLTVS